LEWEMERPRLEREELEEHELNQEMER
jgi:hypothetical protein